MTQPEILRLLQYVPKCCGIWSITIKPPVFCIEFRFSFAILIYFSLNECVVAHQSKQKSKYFLMSLICCGVFH